MIGYMTDLAWRMHTKVAKQQKMKSTLKMYLLQILKHLCKPLAWLNNEVKSFAKHVWLFFSHLEQFWLGTATKTTKTSKMWSRPSWSWRLSSYDDKCIAVKGLWSFFLLVVSPWSWPQFSDLSHCGGFRLQCAVAGPWPPRGTLSYGPWPGPRSTWSRWNK